MGVSIQYASDLHLEFPKNKHYLQNKPLLPVADYLVLAGDIFPISTLNKHSDFLNYISDSFKEVYWLPGNHEYYHSDIGNFKASFCEAIKPNVFLVNNHKVLIEEDIELLFSTLWSKISPLYALPIQQTLSDFFEITFKGKLLKVEDFNRLHLESLQFLEESVKRTPAINRVVFTHHCPTFYNYPNQYKGSNLNEGFAVELFDFIHYSNIKYWIYGHTHINTPAFKIGHTELLSNQLGYVHRSEEVNFHHSAKIEL